MTLLEELKLCAAHCPEHLPAVAQLLNKAAAEIESLQKDSANAYDALSNAQQERDELRRQLLTHRKERDDLRVKIDEHRRQNAELRECLQSIQFEIQAFNIGGLRSIGFEGSASSLEIINVTLNKALAAQPEGGAK